MCVIHTVYPHKTYENTWTKTTALNWVFGWMFMLLSHVCVGWLVCKSGKQSSKTHRSHRACFTLRWHSSHWKTPQTSCGTWLVDMKQRKQHVKSENAHGITDYIFFIMFWWKIDENAKCVQAIISHALKKNRRAQ